MDTLVKGLGPAFAAGFAVQQLLEIIDPITAGFFSDPKTKKVVLSVVSLIVGLALAWGGGLRVLLPLGLANADAVDVVVTALVISAGTEGFNSIMKFLGYAKEDKKASAATDAAKAPSVGLATLNRGSLPAPAPAGGL